MSWKDNAIGLVTAQAGWPNPEFHFVVAEALGANGKPNPNLKPIEDDCAAGGPTRPPGRTVPYISLSTAVRQLCNCLGGGLLLPPMQRKDTNGLTRRADNPRATSRHRPGTRLARTRPRTCPA
jgi:hypothetical protein